MELEPIRTYPKQVLEEVRIQTTVNKGWVKLTNPSTKFLREQIKNGFWELVEEELIPTRIVVGNRTLNYFSPSVKQIRGLICQMEAEKRSAGAQTP